MKFGRYQGLFDLTSKYADSFSLIGKDKNETCSNNVNSMTELNIFNGKYGFISDFYSYGTLLKILMCKLNLSLNRVFNISDKANVLNVAEVPINSINYTSSSFIPIKQKYSIEILTKSILVEDNSYFSFIHLFDTWVWISILLTISILTLIVHPMVSFKLSLIECFIEFFQKLINQDIRNRGHLIKSKKQKFDFLNTLDILLINWIVLSSILVQMFGTKMLEIYSNKRTVPFVQTLEDIINNKQLLIGGYTSWDQMKRYYPEQFEKLHKRLFTKADYPSTKDWAQNHAADTQGYYWSVKWDIIRDVAKGKIVLILETDEMGESYTYSKRFYNLVVPDQKYLMMDYVITIDKNFPFKEEILKGFQTIVEAGLNIIDSSINSIRGDIYNKALFPAPIYDKDEDELNILDKPIRIRAFFSGVFSVYALGLVISILTMIIEMNNHKTLNLLIADKNNDNIIYPGKRRPISKVILNNKI